MTIKFGMVFLPGSRFSSRALSNCGERVRLAQSKKSLKSGLFIAIIHLLFIRLGVAATWWRWSLFFAIIYLLFVRLGVTATWWCWSLFIAIISLLFVRLGVAATWRRCG